MEPFHFDSSGTELLGIYHPASDPATRMGVVICPPFGNESSRVYQATRVLAGRWAEKAHVLRFDYTATGDSFGDWDTAGPARWISDISCAANELAEISGAETIVLAGVRFGALLGANAVAESSASKLILWDPIMSGSQCRAELDRLHAQLLSSHIRLTQEEAREAGGERCGFKIAAWMETELPNLAMPASLPDEVQAVTVVQTLGQHDVGALPQGWGNNGRLIDTRSVSFQCSWDTDPEAILNPAPVIEELSQCL